MNTELCTFMIYSQQNRRLALPMQNNQIENETLFQPRYPAELLRALKEKREHLPIGEG